MLQKFYGRIVRCAAIAIAASAMSTTVDAVQWSGLVSSIVAPDHRPCMFVFLVGVSQADPVVMPGHPWIAIRQSQNGFREIYALLLAAKASGQSVTIQTTGAGVAECDGYVGASGISYTPQ